MRRKTAAIIYNPSSGRRRGRARAIRVMTRLLAEHGIDAVAHPTQAPNHASDLAARAVASGAELVISYGGDGTLNEVIQGMVGGETPLAVWPGGTANVAAHDLGLPFKPGQLASVIAAGKTKRIALGLARFEGGGLKPAERYFFMFAGIGLDASICRGVHPGLKRLGGQVAFWVSGLKHVFTWRAERFVVEIDGKQFESGFALIGNGKGYGGGFRFTPNARLEDPWFEVLVVPPYTSNLRYLRDLLNTLMGDPTKTGPVLVKGHKIRANSAQEPWVEVDGEVVGPLPMSFEIVPDALSIMVP